MTKDEKETLAEIAADMRSIAQGMMQRNSDPYHGVRLELAKEAELRRDYKSQSEAMDPNKVQFFEVEIVSDGSFAEAGVVSDRAGRHRFVVSSRQYDELLKAVRTPEQQERFDRACKVFAKSPSDSTSPQKIYTQQCEADHEPSSLPAILSVTRV